MQKRVQFVQHAFGLIKGRWRSVFTKALEVSVRKAPDVVAACAVMHNVCMRVGDASPEELEEDVDIGGETMTRNLHPRIQKQHKAETVWPRDFPACPVPCGDHDYHAVYLRPAF
ncbi:hypothetical protein MTO96_036988 [Rhipicephalus appendiculatus]